MGEATIIIARLHSTVLQYTGPRSFKLAVEPHDESMTIPLNGIRKRPRLQLNPCNCKSDRKETKQERERERPRERYF